MGLSYPHTLETPKFQETGWLQDPLQQPATVWHPGHTSSTLEQERGQEAPAELPGLCFLIRGATGLAEEDLFEGLYLTGPLVDVLPLLCTLQAEPHPCLAMAPSTVTNELTKAVTFKNQKTKIIQ